MSLPFIRVRSQFPALVSADHAWTPCGSLDPDPLLTLGKHAEDARQALVCAAESQFVLPSTHVSMRFTVTVHNLSTPIPTATRLNYSELFDHWILNIGC